MRAYLRYPDIIWTEGHQVLGGSEGLAILSRFPLIEVRVDDLPASEPPRRMLSADLTKGGSTVRVVCAHTVAVPEEARLRQVAAVLACAGERLIIGGDLNAPPDEILPLASAAHLNDASTVSRRRRGRSATRPSGIRGPPSSEERPTSPCIPVAWITP